MSLQTPFEIGRTYYWPQTNSTQIRETCKVCYGDLRVTIILGNGESVQVQCDACGRGFDGPRGYTDEYSYEPRVKPFTIERVSSMNDNSWYLVSTAGDYASWETLFDTEAEAMTESAKRMQELIDENTRRSATSNKQKLKTKTWHVRYHEDIIRDLQRKIEWHRNKVSERKQPVAP